LLLWGREFPFDLHSTWTLVSDDSVSDVVVQTVHKNYREMNLLAQAFLPFVQPTPSSIQIPGLWVGILAFFIAVGWSSILAACTRVEGFWGYTGLFLFACHLFLSRFATVWAGEDFQLAASGALIIVALIPAYLIQIRTLKLNLAGSFVLFFVFQLILYGVTYGIGGQTGMHETVGSPLVALFVVFFFGLLLMSKDLSALIVFAATNSRNPKRRLGYGMILLLLFALFLVCLLVFLQAYEFLPRDVFYIRPVWLLVPAALVTVFTTQNAYHQIRDLMPAPLSYCLLLMGMAQISLALLLSGWVFAEHSLSYQLDRLVATAFLGVSFFFLVYVFGNLRQPLRKKWNAYYILMFSKVFRFEAIWIIALSMLILVEGMYSWRSYYALVGASINLFADLEIAADKHDQALLWYDQTIGLLPHDIKANYNAANLFLSTGSFYNDPSQARVIVKYLEAADHQGQFPMATASQALFLQLAQQSQSARQLLRKRLEKLKHPQLEAQLAALYYNNAEPDSAILYIKRSLAAEPHQAELFVNLSQVYLAYGKPKESEKYLEAAAALAPGNPFVLQAQYFMDLEKRTHKVDLKSVKPNLIPSHFAANHNLAWLLFREGMIEEADTLAGSLLQQSAPPDLYLLRMSAQAQLDSIDNAISRYYWIGSSYSNLKGMAAHMLAIFYYQKGLPEMSAFLFHEAVEAGMEVDRVNEALMWADLGMHDKAYEQLAICKADFPVLSKMLDHEMALIDFAHGTDTRFLFWDFRDMTYDEAMRGGIYGRQANNNLVPALKFFQPFVDKDSSLTAPYVEIGRIFVNLKDYETGILQYQYGLQRDAKNLPLRSELTRAYFMSGNTQSGDSMLNILKKEQPKARDVLMIEAERLTAKNQAQAALKIYEQVLSANRFDKEATLRAAELYDRTKAFEAGMKTLGVALDHNKKNPEIWYYYGKFTYAFGLDADGIEALKQAQQLAFTPEARARYVAEEKRMLLNTRIEAVN